jgi:hypothetical protein
MLGGRTNNKEKLLDLFVVIGAISQGFGGVYQDRLPFADYLIRRALRAHQQAILWLSCENFGIKLMGSRR